MYVVSNVALSKIGTAFPVNSSSSKPDTTGLEKADQKVHENTGSGLCQGDHPTEALGAEGCNNPFVTDPGNSDNHRQDK